MKKFLHTIVLFSSFGMPFSALSSEDFNLPSGLPENIEKNIKNNKYGALRYLACQISARDLKGIIDLFNKKIPTPKLVEEAKKSLENESYSQEIFQRLGKSREDLLADLSEKSKFISQVDVEKYKSANPDPLDAIPEDVKFEYGNLLGEGAFGTAYAVEVPGLGRFVEKEAQKAKKNEIDNEAKIGNLIRNERCKITPQTQIADVQGLELSVPGKKFRNKSLIQERVQGQTFYAFAMSFKNGWIDSPEKAFERLCGLMSSLYALEKAGIRHADLHALNIMVEKRALPKKEIEAMEKKAEKEGRTPAEEDCYEYVYRLIDFGLSFKIDGTESLEKRSSDMFSLGALMPCFLFGNNVIKILKISYSMSLYDLWTNLKNAAKKELKEGKNDFEQKKIQLILEILALEKDLNRLSPFFQQKIDKIKKEIEAKSQKYKRKYGKNLQSCKTKFEGSLRKKIDEKRNQYVMDGFLEANARMKKAIGLAYPENVLEQLAQFTANCISEDPKQRPTAEEGYQIITNLFFALMTVKK